MRLIEIPIQTVNNAKQADGTATDEDIDVNYCTFDIDSLVIFYDNGVNTTLILDTGDSFVCEFTYIEFKKYLSNFLSIT